MNSEIPKLAKECTAYKRPKFPFANARTAFRVYLQTLDLSEQDEIVLPAYIGWSQKEGSGVFDPIEELGIGYRFYKINRDLSVDLDSLESALEAEHVRVLLIIHYFGFPDPHLEEMVRLARSYGVKIIEDEAHALFSDYWGGIVGRLGDVAILSLHKLLPLGCGGLLVLNNPSEEEIIRVNDSKFKIQLASNLCDYDLPAIAMKRRKNAQHLLDLLHPLEPDVLPLFASIPDGVVPQTLPVLVIHHSRDALYFQMNECGYGVVSLYHTLIEQLSIYDFPNSHWLSRRIFNLPLHQDVSSESIASMMKCLQVLLRNEEMTIV